MQIPLELQSPQKSMVDSPHFSPSSEFDCHDPSNIIFHDQLYYVWYSRNVGDHEYVTTHYAVSSDTNNWTLRGEALPSGKAGSWDESGNLAPYVAFCEGLYYLFYTGFRDSNLSTRHLGYAVAETPAGPWYRSQEGPVLKQSTNQEEWDSDMMGDTNLVYRQGKWCLYFKSKRSGELPWQTSVGLATSKSIKGPYIKHPNNPLFAGHAFSIWVHRYGLAAIRGRYWTEILWSEDGVNFVDTGGRMKNQSTGFYCPENFENGINDWGVDWGFDVVMTDGNRYLQKFHCPMKVVN